MLPSQAINVEDTEAVVMPNELGRIQATITKIAGTHGVDYFVMFNGEHELRTTFLIDATGRYAIIGVPKKLCPIKTGDHVRLVLENGSSLLIEFSTGSFVDGPLRKSVAVLYGTQLLTLMETKILYAEIKVKKTGDIVRFDFKDCDQYGPASNGPKVVQIMLKRLTGAGKMFYS